MNRLKKNFGKKVKEYRESKKYSQSKLAELLDIEPSSLSKIETGASFVSSVILQRLCKYLEIEPVQLFDFKGMYSKDLKLGEKINRFKELLETCTDKELDFLYTVVKAMKNDL